MQTIYNSPIGPLLLEYNDSEITGLYFDGEASGQDLLNEVVQQCINELDEYFKGERKVFTVPVALCGTEFRKAVWRELLNVPYGKTASYKDIAEAVGNPKAVRAVGGANHNNPVSIIVPCHRIVGSHGDLTGYGGGLWRKEWLLEHERKYISADCGA